MARILIVDDDDSARTVVGTILTDLQMPTIDGLELIAVLRDLYTRPAIIAISGSPRLREDRRR